MRVLDTTDSKSATVCNPALSISLERGGVNMNMNIGDAHGGRGRRGSLPLPPPPPLPSAGSPLSPPPPPPLPPLPHECFDLLCTKFESNVGEGIFISEAYLRELQYALAPFNSTAEMRMRNLVRGHMATTGSPSTNWYRSNNRIYDDY